MLYEFFFSNTYDFSNIISLSIPKEKQNLIDCLIILSESPSNIYILNYIKDLMGEIDKNFSKNIQKDS